MPMSVRDDTYDAHYGDIGEILEILTERIRAGEDIA